MTEGPLFDEVAPYYDAWFETPPGAYAGRVEREALLALARPQPGERVLDVGCGTGYFTRALAESEACVLGCDIARQMLRRAADKGLAVAQADALYLPFPRRSFDLVTLVTVLEFIADPPAALDTARQLIRAGGRLVVGTINAWSAWAYIYRQSRESVYHHARFLSPPELVQLLERYGEVSWHTCLFMPPVNPGDHPEMAAMIEAYGRQFTPAFGGFLAARADLA
jgi:ubiquinone/menaquinone biosynthesis C-methylase UbiE